MSWILVTVFGAICLGVVSGPQQLLEDVPGFETRAEGDVTVLVAVLFPK